MKTTIKLIISISILTLFLSNTVFAHDLEVSGIALGAESSATINGKTVKNGAVVNGAEVAEITADYVRFKYKGKAIKVELGAGYDLEYHPVVLGDKETASLGVTNIAINDMTELDWMKKSEILDLREKYVNEHLNLVDGMYKPSEKVFGQMAEGKPWWGTLGISYYGSGKKSIEGPSKESRSIVNPFF